MSTRRHAPVSAGGIPGRDATELDWITFEQSGVLTARQAAGLLAEGALRGLVRSGRWRSAGRGILVMTNGPLTRAQQLWVAVLSAGKSAVLAGATAAIEAGVRGLRLEPIHVLVPAGRKAPTARLSGLPIDMPGVVVHRAAVLPEAHLQVGRPFRTTTARAVVDAAAWARSDDEARTIVAAACQQRRVTPEELTAVLDVLPRVRRRGLIAETARDVAGGAESLAEIDFVKLCRSRRLPAPDLQERRTNPDGRVRYLDAYWRRWSLHAEVDGAHHMDVRHWAQDMRRQNEIWIAGDRILRFPAWVVRRRPAEVAEQLERALRAAGWRPGK